MIIGSHCVYTALRSFNWMCSCDIKTKFVLQIINILKSSPCFYEGTYVMSRPAHEVPSQQKQTSPLDITRKQTKSLPFPSPTKYHGLISVNKHRKNTKWIIRTAGKSERTCSFPYWFSYYLPNYISLPEKSIWELMNEEGNLVNEIFHRKNNRLYLESLNSTIIWAH